MARSRLYPPSVDPRFPALPPQPKGWTRTTFGDVLRVISRPVKLDGDSKYLLVNAKRNRGGITLRRELLGREILTKTQYEARAGDFLISRRQIIHGACGVVPKELDGAVVSNEYSTLRSSEGLLMEFLSYYSHTPYFQRSCFHSSHGVDVEKMIFKIQEWLVREVDLPPMAEQRKIAAILSAVDDAIAKTQAVIEQVEVVKKGLMQELLTRGLPGRHTKFKQTEIGEVPASWEIASCGDLFDVQLGKMMSSQARSGPNQLPYLRNENVHWHRLDMSDVATMHFEQRERQKFRLRRGDLLACEGRHIGRCAIWNEELDECYYQKALHRLRSRSGRISTHYMQFFMMLRFLFMTDLVAEANATSTIPHLPRERLVRLPVWFPRQAEQDEIVDILDGVREKEAGNRRVLDALASVKQALMGVLLTGEVRVQVEVEDTAA